MSSKILNKGKILVIIFLLIIVGNFMNVNAESDKKSVKINNSLTNMVSSYDTDPPEIEVIKPATGINIKNLNIFPFPNKIIYINFGTALEMQWQVEAYDESGIDRVEFFYFDVFGEADKKYPYEGIWKTNLTIFDPETGLHLLIPCPLTFIAYDNFGNSKAVHCTVYIFIIPILSTFFE